MIIEVINRQGLRKKPFTTRSDEESKMSTPFSPRGLGQVHSHHPLDHRDLSFPES